MSKSSNGNIPVLILANKQDLPMALDTYKLERLLGLKELGKECWHIQSTCAITGEGLEEGMAKLHEMINGRRKMSKTNLGSSGSSTSSSNSSSSSSSSSSSALNNNIKKSLPTKVSRKVQRSHSHHY